LGGKKHIFRHILYFFLVFIIFKDKNNHDTKVRFFDPAHSKNFSHKFFEKRQNKKLTKVFIGALQEREQTNQNRKNSYLIMDIKKLNSKESGKNSSTELGQFVINLTQH